MRTVGIICEYNPFHNGHKRQIDILRSMGYDCIVCVMSGNYTQRGELAIFDKYTRAKGAIYGGADIVFELPFPFSSFSAEGFADAGVHILSSIGVDAISFGSECGDVDILSRAADAVLSAEFKALYSDLQKSGIGSTSAYFCALKAITGDDCTLLSNDILGISYIAAIKKTGRSHVPVPIKREGAAFNEKVLLTNEIPSATAIRETLKNRQDNLAYSLENYIPEKSLSLLIESTNSGMAPILADNIEKEMLSFFKLMTPSEIVDRAIARSRGGANIAEDGCGIIERICRASKSARTYNEFIQAAYNSKYTDARINRVILFSLFGVSDKLTHSLPEYTVLLAASGTGREFLSDIRKKCDFPVITKPADAPDCILTTLTRCCDSFYSSAIPSSVDCDCFVKKHPFMLN